MRVFIYFIVTIVYEYTHINKNKIEMDLWYGFDWINLQDRIIMIFEVEDAGYCKRILCCKYLMT